MLDLPLRQVHLDFHTSEKIARIGAEFDPDAFGDTLAAARVNSVTCFARCHHGWVYYDTPGFAERRHPHLERNLLAEQIEACHARGIRVPIYVTVQWDHFSARRHRDWLTMDETGRPLWEPQPGQPGYDAFAPGFYRFLCLNSPYRDFLRAFTREVLQTLPVDGLFFDIVKPQPCACPHCRERMAEAGHDPADAEVRERFGRETVSEFMHEMTGLVRQHAPEAAIFYNSSHLNPDVRELADAYTHFELESLPSGGWGYMHFPLTMRYARSLGKPCLGMTGKFHTSWGDFHSLKNPAALQFECFQMLALGGGCSIGDQLHPEGRICAATYDLIGSVYADIERKEPWCIGARPVTEIGVLNPEEFAPGTFKALSPAALGACRILQEGRHQFDVIDSRSEFGGFRLLVLPDSIRLSAQLTEKLREFLAGGGKLLASHRSGLDPAAREFALEPLGVRYEGDAPYSPDFILPRGDLAAGLPSTEHVMYLRGAKVAPAGGEALAEVMAPYFNRTWEHFCSHRHTPSSHQPAYPGAVRGDGCIYFAHPIFTQYSDNAPRWCKQMALNAIDMLLGEPLVRLDAPSTAVATLNAQPEQQRWVVHLLHYIPERRGQAFDVIEDVIPLRDVAVSVRAGSAVSAVRAVPQEESIPYLQEGGRVEFAVPELHGHQMIALQW